MHFDQQVIEQTFLLQWGITFATVVLNLAAPLAWETLPVYLYRTVQLLATDRHKDKASSTVMENLSDPKRLPHQTTGKGWARPTGLLRRVRVS